LPQSGSKPDTETYADVELGRERVEAVREVVQRSHALRVVVEPVAEVERDRVEHDKLALDADSSSGKPLLQ